MIKITSKHFDVTDSIRERIEVRMDKLARHDVQMINPHVIITQERHEFKIEATIGIPQGKLFAQAKHQDLYAALNAMGHKLEKQLNRLIHKPESQRHASLKKEVDAKEEDFEYELKEENAA